MPKKKKYAVDEQNVFSYTTADKDYIFANTKKNKEGFPLIYPTKNDHNRRVAFSFVEAHIEDLQGKTISSAPANFDILGEEKFSKKDKLADLKLEYIVAILNPNARVKGGVYYHGRLITDKITPKSALRLMKSFLHEYFCLEDGEVIEKAFQNFSGGHLPFWPTHSKNDDHIVFVAHKATFSNADGSDEKGPYDFVISYGDTFDLSKKEDQIKAEALRDLFDERKLVKGVYYKGKLLEERLKKNYKLYLELSFVKKNFTVEQFEFLDASFHKDPRTKQLLFYPMKDAKGHPIALSVIGGVNPDGKELTFHVRSDLPFELNEENIEKLAYASGLFFHKPGYKGALYCDGVLVNGSTLSASEAERRKEKTETALKIHITNSHDFAIINRDYTIEDRELLLRLSDEKNGYYPDGLRMVPVDDPLGEDSAPLFHINDVNLVDKSGEYVFKANIEKSYAEGDKADKNALAILDAFFHKTKKVRGGLYFQGKAINRHRGKAYKQFLAFLPSFVSEEELAKLRGKSEEAPYKAPFALDERYDIPTFWPTKSLDGREVLLSVVDADVHFHTSGGIVKAVNNATFDVYEGETFGLVGESGSGKTTISRAILGINKLTKGGIYFRGKLISSGLKRAERRKTKKGIQMIFQDPAASLNERANVDYIISEGLYNFHLFKSKQERLEKVFGMLRSVGLLPEHLSRYPHEFSGGQRQRIGIARALVIEPRLVLADEPISALDVSIRAQILNLLKKMQNEQGLTYLFIAHDLSIIRYISDRIAVMHKGYIVELGPAEEIYSNPLHPYTRSLLTAIPQPDPKSKNERKKIHYDQTGIVYEECVWKEMLPGHFVYVNDMLEQQIKERIHAKESGRDKRK